MSNHALPPHNNNTIYPQTSTFFSSKLERHISNPTHSSSPSQLFNNSSLLTQNHYNLPSSTARQLNFETPTASFSHVHPQKLDFSQALNKADNMSQTPNYILHKLQGDTDRHMEVEVTDFDVEKENPVLIGQCDLLDELLNDVEIPPKGSKSQVKPIVKEKYLRPKKKTPALMKRWNENEGKFSNKNSTGTPIRYVKNSQGEVIPDPLTHFTRSNSDVPPTLQSNMILVEAKEEMLGDNKYLNNLKDIKHPEKFAQRKQSEEVFPGENSNHKKNFDSFQNKKSSGNGKSKFAKNLFADFNSDAVIGGGLDNGLFQIPEKAAEYDFGPLVDGEAKQNGDNKQGNFEIENLDPISKLLNFESETSDDLAYLDGNAAVSPFDAEDRFMSPKKGYFETPTKSIDMNHASTGKFNLFSTITAKKQSKSNLFSDLMNSTSVTDFSAGDLPSVRKEELSNSGKKETKLKKTLSRFENDYEILETLGSGDLGTVFKCQNKLDGLIYAIKCTNIKLRGENNEGQALNEAQALASLSASDENPFIVRYYNAWIEDDKLYLAMEHCQNNLRKLKNEHVKFSESMIRQIMRDICTGLKHLHSQRIIHLDIKPENILYSKTKKYKIADLGLSTIALLSNNGDITEGDCRYLAPELLSDFSENNFPDLTKADIFAFGATIFELITGAELPRNGQEWIDIRRGNLHKIDNLGYSNSLKSIIKSMMSSNADARPSAHELLTNFLQSEIELELKWEKKQNKGLKKQIKELEDQLGLKRKNSM